MTSDMPPPPPPPPYGAPPPPPPGHPGAFPVAPPSGYAYPGQYANFGQRLVALLIDGLIGLLFSVPAIIALFAGPKGDIRECTIDGEPRLCRYPSGGTIAVSIILGVIGLVAFLYIYCKMIATTGQTWGRKAMHIRVVDRVTGATISMGRSVGRYFAHILSGFFCYLGYLWMLWDHDRQTWHDKLVGTVVVRA